MALRPTATYAFPIRFSGSRWETHSSEWRSIRYMAGLPSSRVLPSFTRVSMGKPRLPPKRLGERSATAMGGPGAPGSSEFQSRSQSYRTLPFPLSVDHVAP